ncbi:MAG: hypothetical protein IPP51_15120 [Bacteroidetes bacterium]|nr:hypothetical protein [Bacteroidota bacterium]
MEPTQLMQILSSIPFDLRAEVVVADLVKSGINLDELFVKPVGIFKRKFGKDIADINYAESHFGEQYMIMSVNREGLYDILPQTLFHNPARKPKPFKSASEMVREVKVRVEEEQNARNFFFAYEAEFFRQRIALEWQERKILDTITYTMNDDTFLRYWELPGFFDGRQKGILFYLLPVFHKIRNNLSLIQETYKTILKNDVSLKNIGLNPELINTESIPSVLGKARLATDSVLGTKTPMIFETIEIEVKNIPADKVCDYLPGGINRKIIKHLNSLFIPTHIETNLKISPQKKEWQISGKDKNTSRLGYSTFA